MAVDAISSQLDCFHACTRDWFARSFAEPTRVQAESWPVIARGENALLLAPTGSGKTLAAFLAAIDRLFFEPVDEEKPKSGIRVLYISPLKALGVDVDRNLRAPVAGLRAFAERHDVIHRVPTVAVRSGDTTQRERARILRDPPDILITTPESLFLMLTSRAREILTEVETVIVDEIHAMAGTKRGAHLFLSLERLETLRRRIHKNSVRTTRQSTPAKPNSGESGYADVRPLQRIGLSATQRPLETIAELLGGAEATADADAPPKRRPVAIIDASEKRRFALTVETPAEDRSRADAADEESPGLPAIPSVWPSIHPRLVELIRQHRSTMIFSNSRRLAERLATAINDLAEEEIALAHHGSVAREVRTNIEDRLKRGDLPAIVATSSMELGIDMGAVDLVIQIEAPPSIASGTQRIGRAGHQVGAVSSGILFPKFRGDLLACATTTGAMRDGWVEETQYPRNPLDVLAQQIVAIVAMTPVHKDDLYSIVRGAAPFFSLPKSSFHGVLDLLSGRYPSDEFSELRPRLNWDRISGELTPRRGAQRLAIMNAGTIPDRGLFGVYLAAGDGESGSRVGELDEEMVFECRPGDVFLLGASAWRVMEITRDRVLVLPAPGEPGRMPFWRGDGPGRPLEFGRAIGQLTRQLLSMPADEAILQLRNEHGLEESAAVSLMQYLDDQQSVDGAVPHDQRIVIECFPDEVGDWRVVVLTAFGSRVHAPWATLITERLMEIAGDEVDVNWNDDGMVFRVPKTPDPPPLDVFFPDPDDVEDRLVRTLGGTALFSAKFRENAARSLLLPRRSPQKRSPLWLQRRKSAGLLKVAARFPAFPILIETYRECLQDVFDVKGLTEILRSVQTKRTAVRYLRSDHPSPFSASVLFNYAGNFIYDGDAPLAERRAATLALDHAQLKELLGTADFRELFDANVIADLALELQRLTDWTLRDADDVHDLLMHLGPLTEDGIRDRSGDAEKEIERSPDDCRTWLHTLLIARRVFELSLDDDRVLYAASEDAGRLRDALGIVPPSGMADAFLEPVEHAVTDLVSRYARTHTPFTTEAAAAELGLSLASVKRALETLKKDERVLAGEFLPGGRGTEWCDSTVFRRLRQRCQAALREQVEPVDQRVLARFLPEWHGIPRRQSGLDGLLDVLEQLQGTPLPASTLENEILPCRVHGFRPSDLDELFVAGEIIWRGLDSTGTSDGRIAVYLIDSYRHLAPLVAPLDDPQSERIRELLRDRGGRFFDQLCAEISDFPNDLLDALWRLVWNGEVTNDTLAPLRSLRTASVGIARRRERHSRSRFRSRRTARLPGSEGRWSLLPLIDTQGGGGTTAEAAPTTTERQTAIAGQLVDRYGILTKEMLAREQIAGGFAGVYPVLKAMEESGRIRRGYFVAGLGAAQFAAAGAEDRLRAQRESTTEESCLMLAATDPANPWGNILPWPDCAADVKLQRTAGAIVFIRDGHLLAWLSRSRQQLVTFPELQTEESGDDTGRLLEALRTLTAPRQPLLLTQINGQPAGNSELRAAFTEFGFTQSAKGLQLRHQV